MGKTLVINGADFSSVSVGHVDLPRRKSAYTDLWVEASGNTFSEAQINAIDDFIKTIGVGQTTSIYGKIDRLWLPMLAPSIANSLVDYRNNFVKPTMSAADLETFNARYSFVSHGLIVNSGSTVVAPVLDPSFVVNNNNLSMFIFNTLPYTAISSGTADMPAIGTSTNDANCRISFVQTPSAIQNRTFETNNTVYDTSSDRLNCHLRGASSTSSGRNILKSDGTISSASAVTSVSQSGITILRLLSYNIAPTTIPQGAFIVGKAMSDSEMITLQSAVETLFSTLYS